MKRTKMARCANGGCLEVEFGDGQVELKSTTGKGGKLTLTSEEWNTFLGQAGDKDWRA